MKEELKKPILPPPLMLALFLVNWILGLLILLFTKQGDSLLWLNSFSNKYFDIFFLYVTLLGNGLFAFFLAFVFLFKKLYYALCLGLSFIMVSIFTNLLKHFVFIQHYRPLWYLYYNDFHRVIIDAPINYLRSFPSGHSMTAFAMATILSILFRKKSLSIIFFISALIISWSRVYLCQHFYIDIFWGAILGFFAALIGKIVIDRIVLFFKADFMALPIQQAIPYLITLLKHKA